MNNFSPRKNCLITGANSGIGKALCIALARHGMNIIMICRNSEKGKQAQKVIIEQSGNEHIDLFIMDLSSQKSIKDNVIRIQEKYKKIDVLINNAGTLLFKKELTEEKIEKTLATNLIGPFLLTNLLLEQLKKSDKSRIINVVSEGIKNNQIDPAQYTSNEKYKPVKAYSYSKQAVIYLTYKLAEILDNSQITCNCYYPGLVKTNLGKAEKGFRKLTYNIFTKILSFIFTPMEQSIKLGIFLAISKKAENMNGKFLYTKKNRVIIKNASNKEICDHIWKMCIKLTGT